MSGHDLGRELRVDRHRLFRDQRQAGRLERDEPPLSHHQPVRSHAQAHLGGQRRSPDHAVVDHHLGPLLVGGHPQQPGQRVQLVDRLLHRRLVAGAELRAVAREQRLVRVVRIGVFVEQPAAVAGVAQSRGAPAESVGGVELHDGVLVALVTV
jgi:hypothetical protein